MTTGNMDFTQRYRPRQSVLTRPAAADGRSKKSASRGFAQGRHELAIPLPAPAFSYNGRRP